MKPNYDVISHIIYLHYIKKKWVEQLQEFLFDRKERLTEGSFLNIMGILKDEYEESTECIRKFKQGRKVTDNQKYLQEACDLCIKEVDMLGALKQLIICFSSPTDSVSDRITQAKNLRKIWEGFPCLKTLIVNRYPSLFADCLDEHDDEGPEVDVLEDFIGGKKYYIGCGGIHKNMVYSQDFDHVGLLINDKIVFN